MYVYIHTYQVYGNTLPCRLILYHGITHLFIYPPILFMETYYHASIWITISSKNPTLDNATYGIMMFSSGWNEVQGGTPRYLPSGN